MVAHQVFAQICEGEIKNVIVCDNYEMANWLARASYGNNAFAIDCLQYPCGIGDKYHDGAFYHVGNDGNETEVKPVITAEQEVQALNAQVAYLSMMSDIDMEGV
ncbi:hypothetical protein [Lacrimispora indolis]|uniref:hypothetical protein n=1 Tax=Lacrimispora indolis TaxID=69825 RepID=UPI00045EC4CF|nr:hypothetical protein [Lacrimispora indolis]MBE7718823.1 hypothetical protein [Lacrimispora celerecrescens]